MIDGIKIFDGHMHYIGRFKPRDESLVEFMDRYGIDKAAVTTLNQAANLDRILKSNGNIGEKEYLEDFLRKEQYDHEDLRKIISKNPNKLFGFFWFNPKIANEDDWKLLEKYIKDYHFKGIKTQWCVDLLDVPGDLLYLAEFCIDNDAPLFIHSGTGFFYQKPVRAKDHYQLARKYRELKLIIGHAAHTMEHCINCLNYFSKMANVYFETSTSIPYGIMTLIKAMGSQRVIYGSDSPTANPPDIEINKILCLNLDKKSLENVFYNNIIHLLGIEE
ncbi:MAG: amidohydrolase family protein [Promethearchaeota archaeon]